MGAWEEAVGRGYSRIARSSQTQTNVRVRMVLRVIRGR